jgi:hypothetical protein
MSNDPDEQYVNVPVHLQVETTLVCGDAMHGRSRWRMWLPGLLAALGIAPNSALGDLNHGSISIADTFMINYIFRRSVPGGVKRINE